MNLHLAEISRTVAPDAHAVLIMDQIIATRKDRGDALQVGRLLTHSAKAAGASATLQVEGDGGSGGVSTIPIWQSESTYVSDVEGESFNLKRC